MYNTSKIIFYMDFFNDILKDQLPLVGYLHRRTIIMWNRKSKVGLKEAMQGPASSLELMSTSSNSVPLMLMAIGHLSEIHISRRFKNAKMLVPKVDKLHIMNKFERGIALSGFGKTRIPFQTEKGYIGLADIGVQLGDEICIVQGFGVPYVVRKMPQPQAGTMLLHQLVCESYVHGLMHGEEITGRDWQDIFAIIVCVASLRSAPVLSAVQSLAKLASSSCAAAGTFTSVSIRVLRPT